MQQQLFAFVPAATTGSLVRLDPEVVEELTRLMVTAIIAVAVEEREESDDESGSE